MKFSQTFVTYHGCGYCYVDGTNLLQGTTRCFFPIHNPFWKEPCDASNRIAKSTRNQLKKKSIATRSYCKEYFKYIRKYKKSNNNVIFENGKIWQNWTDSSEDSSEDKYSNSDVESNNSNYTDKSENSNNKFPIHTIKKEDTFQTVNSTPIIINSENNATNNELTGENLITEKNSQTANNKLIPAFI